MSTYSIFHMRDDIASCYDSPTWKHRVKFMSDKQVYAIWHAFYADGKFDKKLPKRAEKMAEKSCADCELKKAEFDAHKIVFETTRGEQLALDI